MGKGYDVEVVRVGERACEDGRWELCGHEELVEHLPFLIDVSAICYNNNVSLYMVTLL